MSQQIPWSEYAVQKVTKFVPPCAEKSTLVAIAAHLNYTTGVAWPKISTIAHEAGHSVPTVKRHLKQLEAKGYLVVDRPAKHEHRPSHYRIPCCAFTVSELEFITGISGQQLLLGVIEPDTIGSGVTIGPESTTVAERQWVSGRYPMGITVIPDGYQDDTLTLGTSAEQESRARILLEKGLKVKQYPKTIVPAIEEPHRCIATGKPCPICGADTIDPIDAVEQVNPEVAAILRRARELEPAGVHTAVLTEPTRVGRNVQTIGAVAAIGVQGLLDAGDE